MLEKVAVSTIPRFCDAINIVVGEYSTWSFDVWGDVANRVRSDDNGGIKGGT